MGNARHVRTVMGLVGETLPVKAFTRQNELCVEFTLEGVEAQYTARNLSKGTTAEAAHRILEGVAASRASVDRENARLLRPRVTRASLASIARAGGRPLLERARGNQGPPHVFGVDAENPQGICRDIVTFCGGGMLHYTSGTFNLAIKTGGFWLSRNVVTLSSMDVLPEVLMISASGRRFDEVISGTPLDGAEARIARIRQTPLGSIKITLHEDAIPFDEACALLDAMAASTDHTTG